MKKLICLLIVLLPTLAYADDIDLAVKYQLQLAKLTREREQQPPIVQPPTKKRTLDEAEALAIKTAKPLVVWLGKAICPSCIDATNDEFINFAADSLPGFPADSITVYMRKSTSPEVKLVGYVKGWQDDGKHGHLPTIRKILRRHDDTGLVIHEVIAWESQPLLPPITYQTQMQAWPQPMMYQPPMMQVQPMRMVAPRSRFMGGGRACAT